MQQYNHLSVFTNRPEQLAQVRTIAGPGAIVRIMPGALWVYIPIDKPVPDFTKVGKVNHHPGIYAQLPTGKWVSRTPKGHTWYWC